MAEILTKQDAQNAAKKMVEDQAAQQDVRRFVFEDALKDLKNFEITQNSEGFEEISSLLMLSEEKFAILAPIFLRELEKGSSHSNTQLFLAQALNIQGLKSEDIAESYNTLCDAIDSDLAASISVQKRDFLKQMLGITFNSVAEAEGIAKRHMVVPIEYCREDAKMPTYAHLTDAGMDVYLTEDVTIHPGETKLIPLGIKVALPMGYELQVRPKSGRSLKSKLRIANTPGTIDAGYRDEICIIADNIDPVIRSAEMDENGRLYNIVWGSDIMLSKGEKIAQLVLSEVPKAIFYQVESVAAIENDGRRGGFGSTGDK